MIARENLHHLVDTLPENELDTAQQLLEALAESCTPDELEDAVDSYLIRRYRLDQQDDAVESLDDFGKRLGLG